MELTWNDFLIIPIIDLPISIIHISSIRWVGVKRRTLKTLTHFEKILYFFVRVLVAELFDQCSYSRSKESTFHLTCSASQNISNLSYIVYIIRYQYNCQPELNHVLMLKLSYRTTLRCLKRGNDKRCISAFKAVGVRMD